MQEVELQVGCLFQSYFFFERLTVFVFARFVHPDQPQWTSAIESNLTKRKRAMAAVHSHQDSGYGSRSKGRDSGRGSITSSTAGWGDTSSGRVTPQRQARDPSPGWGSSNTGGGGWGNSGSGGWGNASPVDGGWGNTSTSGNDGRGNKSGDGGFGNTSSSGWGDGSGGWGNPEPSSRRTSTLSAPKSPEKAPRSPRRERESDKSPSRHGHSSSSSKEKDRDRERGRERGRDRDRDRDRDRESRREEVNVSPSRSHRSHRRSPSPGKPSSKSSSHKELDRSPERPKPKSSHAASDTMDIDTPNPSSIEAPSSLFASALKEVDVASVSATPATTLPTATTPTNEMPISIAFPRVRQHDGLGPPPLGFALSAPRAQPPSTTSTQPSMPAPPPPSSAPPVVPSPPTTMPAAKSPPQSSDATKPHSLPTRPHHTTGSRSPPQTRTLATPMTLGSPKHAAIPATPATPTTPAAPVVPTAAPALSVPPAPLAPETSAASVPSTPVQPVTPPVERPYEWIESLDALIKQIQVLRNCKKQYERAEAQEKILLNRGASIPKRGMGDIAPSMAEMRRRIESTESDIQALMAQFATRMDMFYRPTEVVKQLDVGKTDEETLSLARKLSDQVSLLEAEMQQLQITGIKPEELKKLEESIKSGSQAILKERGERTKVVEDVKKDVKILGDDLNRTKIEYERLREELITSSSNLEQVRCDAQTVREQQVIVKEEVKAVKVEADATKSDVQTVKTKMGEVGKEVADIKLELQRLKTRLKTPPSSPAPAPKSASATAPGKRARNGVLPHDSNAMEVDDALPPAKRVRTIIPLRPSPLIDSTTPLGSPRSVQHDGPSPKELLERIDALEDLVETLQGDVLQVGTDVQDQLEEMNERLGSSEARVNAVSITESRAESAPPGSMARGLKRARRPSSRRGGRAWCKPASWGPAKLPTVEELPSDDAIGTLRVDLDAMMGQVFPETFRLPLTGRVQFYLNTFRNPHESLDEVFKPVLPPAPEPVVNGRKPEPEEDWVAMFKSMKEEQTKMREEMKKERAEQDARMKAMIERLERTEEALDKSIKRALLQLSLTLRNFRVVRLVSVLLVHLQSVVDNLPKPGNGMLSPEGDNVLRHALPRSGQAVLERRNALLATTVPHLLALAGISAEKDN
ncbi:unnamed protein product [Rhizoctonia solani]|uniref:Uncharacterized protein n=1 Tax=Rhizoctonia solani TaxID=456999 RepID=A0A8H3AMC4_9AGAM|nr:unnamed protein product [Rhizoctonia solani]